MPVSYLKETPSQTAGPYVHIGTMPAVAGLEYRTGEVQNVIAGEGQRILVEGTVLDGSGAPVRDAMLELWQADAAGNYGADGFRGWGRAASDFTSGLWRFETVKPGASRGPDGRLHAPYLTLLVFSRGINIHLHTRLYFPEETEANAADPGLQRIELVERRKTLIAEKTGEASYRFDIRLQGERETVFFDI